VLVFAELFRSLAARSPNQTLFGRGLFSNPALLVAVAVSAALQVIVMSLPLTQRVFGIPAESWNDWLLIGGLSLVPVTLLEAFKLVRGGWRKLTKTKS
jgi:Ca2+-transporting ATPase